MNELNVNMTYEAPRNFVSRWPWGTRIGSLLSSFHEAVALFSHIRTHRRTSVLDFWTRHTDHALRIDETVKPQYIYARSATRVLYTVVKLQVWFLF